MSENKQMKEMPSYYSIIPSTVRYCKDISAQEKLLYSEITALTNHKGYCWATNNYFADLYGLSKKTISRQISNLAEHGFIRVEMIYFENSNQIKERRIYLPESDVNRVKENADTPIDNNADTPLDKNADTLIDKNADTPIDNNAEDNNLIGVSIKGVNISNPIISNRFNKSEQKKEKTDMIRCDETPIQSVVNEKGQKNKESFQNATMTSNQHLTKPSAVKYSVAEVEEIIKSNIDYDYILLDDPHCKEMLDGVLHVIVSTIVTDFRGNYIGMGEENVPAEIVKSVFFKLTKEDIEYFIENFNRQTKPTTKLNAYIRTSLYRNHGTNDFYCKNLVNVDMPQFANKKIHSKRE